MPVGASVDGAFVFAASAARMGNSARKASYLTRKASFSERSSAARSLICGPVICGPAEAIACC